MSKMPTVSWPLNHNDTQRNVDYLWWRDNNIPIRMLRREGRHFSEGEVWRNNCIMKLPHLIDKHALQFGLLDGRNVQNEKELIATIDHSMSPPSSQLHVFWKDFKRFRDASIVSKHFHQHLNNGLLWKSQVIYYSLSPINLDANGIHTVYVRKTSTLVKSNTLGHILRFHDSVLITITALMYWLSKIDIFCQVIYWLIVNLCDVIQEV